jgi:TolA-binding protein
MDERMKGVDRLDRLGSHVAGSLEQLRTSGDAASRVRARLAAGATRTRTRNSEPRARLRPGAIAGVLAVAAALCLVSFFAWREHRRSSAPLTFVVAGEAEHGVVGAFLAAPASAELPLSFSDGTSVRVGAGARARVAEVGPRGARLLVESGVVHASVVHREDTRWLVDAGPFEVKVTGTRFDVAWAPGEQAIVVTLHEGSVVVSGCGLADGQRVSGGQQLRASCKSGTASLGPIDPAPPSTLAVAVAAPPEAIATATAASSLPDAPHAPPAPTPLAHVASASASASGSPAASASDLLARATADRYAGRFDAASTSLETVRHRFAGSDAAATAAFELGRIAFDGHHDFAAAGDWFDTYLRERPSGSLAREALGRAIEARHRAGDVARAEQLATRYVATYPDGPHATLARRLAAARRAGDEP